MTIQQLYESLRQHAPNLGFTEALVLLNQASRDFVWETKILDSDDTSITTTADTLEYAVPSNLFRIDRVWVGDDEAIKLIGNIEIGASTIASEKFFWQLNNGQLSVVYDSSVFEYVDAGETIKIRSKKYDDAYTATTDEPSFPSEYHVALLYKILADIYMKPDMLNLNVSQTFRIEYERLLRKGRKYAKTSKNTAGAPTPVYF
jgi:hypothetical protein